MSKESLINSIKSFLFPSLVTLLAMMIWRDVTEMRSDIKSLLAQASVDKTKIEQLERDMRSVEQTVYNKRQMSQNVLNELSIHNPIWFKHEDIYSIEENIQTEKL